MIQFIKRLFTAEPGTKIRKLINQKHTQAVQLQRNGKLREYAKIMKEIDDLEAEYEDITNETV